MLSIKDAAHDHILLAAHRGVAGGNIPCNTQQAYQIALNQGADIVEIDVAVSADRQLFVFHPGMEPAHLRSQKFIRDMTAEEVDKQRFVNQDGTPTECPVSRLDDILELLKGKCFVNVDKFWTAVPEIAACIRRHGMQEQVIVKAPVKADCLEQLEMYAADMPYMPIINKMDTVTDELLKRRITLLGAEVLFYSDDDQTASEAYIESMHKRGLLLWANSIIYDYRAQIAARHSDDVAMVGDPDSSWGWLVDRHFDMIQTDWILPLRLYLQARGQKVR